MKTFLLVLVLASLCGCSNKEDQSAAASTEEPQVASTNKAGKAIANFAINSLFGSIESSARSAEAHEKFKKDFKNQKNASKRK